MYKVFFNGRTITIAGEDLSLPHSADSHTVRVESPWQVPGLVKHFLNTGSPDWVLIGDNEDKLWSDFIGFFSYILAAGGVVKKGDRYLFMFRRGKWDLPKGKVETGETLRDAAFREVEEECGITGMQIVQELTTTWHIYMSPWPESLGQWVLKQTVWFAMDYNGNETLVPQKDEGITKLEWLAKNDIGKVLENTYPNLLPVIKTIADS